MRKVANQSALLHALREQLGLGLRVIYVAKFAEAVYVLHAFQKKSQRTARLDIELARSRFKSLMNERRVQ
jgi:phage-related protein